MIVKVKQLKEISLNNISDDLLKAIASEIVHLISLNNIIDN